MSLYSPVFDTDDVKIKSRGTVFQGFFAIDRLTLSHRLYAGGWSQTFTRELFRRDRAAGILLHDTLTDTLVMVEQFRVGMLDSPGQSPWVLELVAGILDPGEQIDQMARREVREETGLVADELQFICEYYNSPGGSTECISLFYAAVDASKAGGIHGLITENEDIRVVPVPYSEACRALAEGRINNAMAIIALQWLQLKKSKDNRRD
jgi:ADP-ribose pyrophosphatase